MTKVCATWFAIGAACVTAACDGSAVSSDSGVRPDGAVSVDAGGQVASGRDSGTEVPEVDAGLDAGREDRDPPPAPPDRFATAMIAEAEGDTGITGIARFEQFGTNVTVIIAVEGCPDGPHGTHIHAGNGCADRAAQGAHWGPTRGEGIPALMCSGGVGRLIYTRDARDPDLAWTIGDGSESDIVGHPVVVHGSTDPSQRIGCGVITE